MRAWYVLSVSPWSLAHGAATSMALRLVVHLRITSRAHWQVDLSLSGRSRLACPGLSLWLQLVRVPLIAPKGPDTQRAPVGAQAG
jgi:hypothetical protein